MGIHGFFVLVHLVEVYATGVFNGLWPILHLTPIIKRCRSHRGAIRIALRTHSLDITRDAHDNRANSASKGPIP